MRFKPERNFFTHRDPLLAGAGLRTALELALGVRCLFVGTNVNTNSQSALDIFVARVRYRMQPGNRRVEGHLGRLGKFAENMRGR